MARRGLVVVACTLVACGISGVGASDESPPAAPAAAPAASGSADVPTEIPVVVPETDPGSDASPPPDASAVEGGASCAVDGTACTTATGCCSNGCTSASKCGMCLARDASCTGGGTPCCRGDWCGRFGSGPNTCNKCLDLGQYCGDQKGNPQSGICCGTCKVVWTFGGYSARCT